MMQDAGYITTGPAEISLGGLWWSAIGYQPPHYPRSIAYEDTVSSDGDQLVVRRSVTDQGPLLGIWGAFKIPCLNGDHFNPVQIGRGEYLYNRFMHLYRGFVGSYLVLIERQTGFQYNVTFAADGLQQELVQPQDMSADGTYLGNEWYLTISLLEVSVD